MGELREDSAPYVGYDYKEIPANADKTPLYLDGYESFGWVLEERPGTQPLKNKGKLVLRRDRKIVNKMELTRLQRHFEACLRELDQLEESRTARARICAVMTGILGTAFLAGSTFAVTHQPPMVALRFSAQFCPQGDTRGKEFLSRACGQKWVPPGAWRFCDTLTSCPAGF